MYEGVQYVQYVAGVYKKHLQLLFQLDPSCV